MIFNSVEMYFFLSCFVLPELIYRLKEETAALWVRDCSQTLRASCICKDTSNRC